MLIGNKLNLRIMEKKDMPILKEWVNSIDFIGEFEPLTQETITDLEKQYESLTEGQWFFIEKKDGMKIGYVAHFISGSKQTAIGYALLPNERRKGYGTEAILMIVDYLFLSKSIIRIQAEIHPNNIGSQRVLEKAGLVKEGILRKSFFSRGEWRDTAILSVLREEWKEPKILTEANI